MGTRGAIGFIVGEQEKIAYNHFDSYPSGRGLEVLRYLREHPADEIRPLAEKLMVVDDETSPATPEQILALRDFSDWHVNQFSMAGPPGGVLPTEDVSWYNLLRGAQGDIGLILGCGYMEDASGFPLDSLFCEWGYIIDLDNEVLEVYKGFNKRLRRKGRWAGRPTAEEDATAYAGHLKWCAETGRDPWMPPVSEYKAVALVATYPLDELPSDVDFITKLEGVKAAKDLVS